MDARGVITTVAGSGRAGFSGDGGPAIRTSLNQPWDVAVDDEGTLPSPIRTITGSARSAKRIITTVAGEGSSLYETGDGGAATNAQCFPAIFLGNCGRQRGHSLHNRGVWSNPQGWQEQHHHEHGHCCRRKDFSGIAVDLAGAVYLAGRSRSQDRYAGHRHAGRGHRGGVPSGDGGPATSAGMALTGIAVDRTGALFIASFGNNRVRKVDSNGIITTVAGSRMRGSSGDGGPATSAAWKPNCRGR